MKALLWTAALTPVISTALLATPVHADAVRDKQWHLSYLNVTQAHKVTKGEGVTVAVVDTGVDRHPDLEKNLLRGTNVIPGASGDGQRDESGHGTSMAGLIAGHGRAEGTGVLGIAPAAKILPVKDQEPGNVGGSSTIAAGIEWAARNGASVINVSAASAPTVSLKTAVETATATDALIVAGTGNRPDFIQMGYPAAIPGVLAVGAIDRSGKRASFSVGGEATAICAPGVDMESTRLRGRYYISFGTSPATAVVSGAAALVRAKYPDLSAREVIHRLTATATDIGKPGRDEECGYGVLNIVKALTADVPPLDAEPPTSPSSTPTPPSNAAPDNTEPTGSNTPAIAGVISAATLLLGGLLAVLLLRRRHKPGETP